MRLVRFCLRTLRYKRTRWQRTLGQSSYCYRETIQRANGERLCSVILREKHHVHAHKKPSATWQTWEAWIGLDEHEAPKSRPGGLAHVVRCFRFETDFKYLICSSLFITFHPNFPSTNVLAIGTITMESNLIITSHEMSQGNWPMATSSSTGLPSRKSLPGPKGQMKISHDQMPQKQFKAFHSTWRQGLKSEVFGKHDAK